MLCATDIEYQTESNRAKSELDLTRLYILIDKFPHFCAYAGV